MPLNCVKFWGKSDGLGGHWTDWAVVGRTGGVDRRTGGVVRQTGGVVGRTGGVVRAALALWDEPLPAFKGYFRLFPLLKFSITWVNRG